MLPGPYGRLVANVRSDSGTYTSICSAIRRASSTSTSGIGRCFQTWCDRAESARLGGCQSSCKSVPRHFSWGSGAHRRWLQGDGRYQSLDNPGVLPRRQMLRRLMTAWEQIAAAAPSDEWEPWSKCSFRLVGHFELYGPLRSLLDISGSTADRATRPQVFDPQSY
jgi:hypothetical protein